MLLRLVRAHRKAAAFIEDTANREEVSAILAAPNRIDVAAILAVPNRADVASEVIRRTLDGRMKVTPDGAVRIDERYLLVGRDGAARPDPVQAAWLYAQMVRWGQAPLSAELLAAATGVVRPDLYDAAMPGDVAEISRAIRRTASARSPAPHSTPTTSPDTSRAGRSSAPVEATAAAALLLAALHKPSAVCGANGQKSPLPKAVALL